MRNPRPGEASPDLVTIRTFVNEVEANLAKSQLEAAGIDATLARDDCGGLRPSLTFAQGIELVVRSGDVRRAAAVLTDEHEIQSDPAVFK